ncbi:hypothetical protein ZEAMMB73_Zm00001d010120, partial [Zea mays]
RPSLYLSLALGDSWVTVVAAALLQVPRSSQVPLPPLRRRRAPARLFRRLNYCNLGWFEGRKEAEPWGRESQLLSHLLRSGWTSLTLYFPAHLQPRE